ncbi:MAG: hypothetical protein LBR68_00825 [Lachnoclostridium sp.]|nr:hypothetical protein [Lachnoclostridium sp.]
MKTAKLVLGIISMVLFIVITMQSCAVGIVNTVEGTGEVSGTAGMMLAICMLVAGIVGVATRNKGKGGSFTAGGFYLVGAIIAAANAGTYGDLTVWTVISAIFGIVFILGTILAKPKDME